MPLGFDIKYVPKNSVDLLEDKVRQDFRYFSLWGIGYGGGAMMAGYAAISHDDPLIIVAGIAVAGLSILGARYHGSHLLMDYLNRQQK